MNKNAHLKAQKYIEDHNNPLLRVELPHLKLFLRPEIETTNEDPLKPLEIALKHDRVERRCARACSEWLPDQNLVKITKIIGVCAQFGFQNRNGKFLYPEEALYLLETNRLELFLNEIPLSIQEAYKMLLKSSDCNFKKYRVFRNMTLQGYHLVRKLKTVEDEEEPPKKKAKLSDYSIPESSGDLKFYEIFEKLKEGGPQEYQYTSSTVQPDYFVYFPTNSTRITHDFKLFISDNAFEDFCGQLVDKAVYAFCSDDTVAFYKFGQIHLPDLT